MQQQMGMPSSIRGQFAGTAEAFQKSMSSEPFLILGALLAIYIVLGILYESLIHPITILTTLPSASVGAFLSLILFHSEFDVISFIGIILLVGIVKKNAIMMIDFALQAERRKARTRGTPIFEACLLRFRPILMTTCAAILGALPLAFGRGTGSELRHPLGIAVVGGLVFSQIMTLYHHACDLPVFRSHRPTIQAPQRGSPHSGSGPCDSVRSSPMVSASTRLFLAPAVICGLLMSLTGCTVGPKYTPPALTAPPVFKETAPQQQPRRHALESGSAPGYGFTRQLVGDVWRT